MSQAISVTIKAPKPDVSIITHQTTPLPVTRASQKEKPVSPGRILRGYAQSIHENMPDDDDLFPITEDVSNTPQLLENDSKHLKARKSFNNVLADLSTAAAEQQKRKSREIMPEIQSNNNEYSSDSSYTSYRQSHSRSHSLSDHNPRTSNHHPTNITHNMASHQAPYIDDDGSETDSNVDSSFSNDPNVTTRTNRYSTFVKQYVHQPMDDDDDSDDDAYAEEDMDEVMDIPDANPAPKKGVSFADSPHEKQTHPKRSRVRFSMHTDDIKNDSDSSSSLTSQSEDLMDFWNDNKPTYDDIEEEIEKMHSFRGDDMKKHRQSKFFKFSNTNFMQSTLKLRSLTNLPSIDVNKEPLNTPGAPLPDAMENAIEFSDTASTTDFNPVLWKPVSDRSDSSDDSILPRRKKSRKKKAKKRNTAVKTRSAPEQNDPRSSYNENDIAAEIDLFKRSVLNDEDIEDEDDEDAYTLDESSSVNPFDAIVSPDLSDDTDNDSDSIHDTYYQNSKQKGDRMWFRHHIGHLKVLKKFFREMDKDKDGTISFDEFTKFLSKYAVNKKFTAEEIERFFLKVTESDFDPDNPNVIEDKMAGDNIISPNLLASSNSSLDKAYKDQNTLSTGRKSGVAKKTSIFFKKAKAVPTGEMDMATFLFYFSSPIDSNAMQQHELYRDANNSVIAPHLAHIHDHNAPHKGSVITADNIARNKLASVYSKAVARAADKARNRPSNNTKQAKKQSTSKRRIDPSLLFITKGEKGSKPIHKRHSLMTKSTGKKLQKRKNKNDKSLTKRGSISTLRSYHFKQRESKHKLLEDEFDIEMGKAGTHALNALDGMNELLASQRESKASHKSSSALSDELDKKYQSAEELEALIKMMKRNIPLQDRKNNKYKNCFVGRDAVTWFLSKGFVSSRHGGLLLGRRLAQRKYIKYAGDEERDFEDEIIFFYQFTSHVNHHQKSTDEMDSLRSSLLEPTLTGMDSYSDGNVTEMKEDSTATTTSSQVTAEYLQLGDGRGIGDHSASNLAAIVSKMSANIPRTSHRSNTLSGKEDISSGKEIVDWLIKFNHCRSKGFIRHIEFHPVFRDAEDEWYRICDHDVMDVDVSKQAPRTKLPTGMNHIMEGEVNTVSADEIRATLPAGYSATQNNNKKDSVASTMTANSDYKPLFFGVPDRSSKTTTDRTSLVLGQMGRGRATRGRKREKLVEELFTFIIASQITTGEDATSNMSPEAMYEMDRIVDAADHPHIAKLLSKIEIKFKKCDEHGRGSLGAEEFNRFLIKCGVILHQQDLNVVFKIFDKNNTGLIDFYNFSENALVHRVPGIKTEHLSVTHLIKHTISVNFGISAGRKGNDDQFTVMSMAISAAFEEINTSQTGEITLDEFRMAYRKHGIEIYGGVTQIFQRLSKNGATVTLANFIEAFQGTIFANRSEAPKLKEVLSKLGIIQWTLGDPTADNNLYDAENTKQSTEYDESTTAQGGFNKLLSVNSSATGAVITPQTMSARSSANGDENNIIMQQQISNENDDTGFIMEAPNGISSPTVISICTTNDSKGTLPQVDEQHGRTETINSALSEIPLEDIQPITRQYSSEKSPTAAGSVPRIRLNLREVSHRVFVTFLKSTVVIALPGIVLNSLLHFVQAIPVGTQSDDFPLIDLTWYLFGFLVYLALQSTMVGFEVTKSLILFFFLVAGTIGALLAIATIVGFAFEDEIGIRDLRNELGLGWWIGLFFVYLICECAARLKFMKIFGTQRTRREYCWYAVSHAIGVTIFWFLQTFMSILVVNVSFDDSHPNRWPLIIYCALTLTVIRNLSLNTLGTAFIAKLSDHFYLEDVEVMEMRTDQMLLTQLSIIASYSPLWYLFTKTTPNDWNWVIWGILVYQCILLLMDITLTTYIRPKMISLLKGELIAWFAVGARAVMTFIFPLGFNENNLIQQEYDDKWTKYIDVKLNDVELNLIWCATYAAGPCLLLLSLWLRIYKIWSYENIQNYWDFNEFTINCSRSSSSTSIDNNKQRNRLMIICALTIGFIVSVTESVSLWSDDASTQKYEGFLCLGCE